MAFVLQNPMLVAGSVGVFLAVALLAGTMGGHGDVAMSPGRRRLRALTDGTGCSSLTTAPLVVTGEGPGPAEGAGEARAEIAKGARPDRPAARRAGYYHSSGPLLFAVLEMVTATAGVIVPLVMLGPNGPAGRRDRRPGRLHGAGPILMRKIEHRRRQLQNGLPDALDLFVVCLEAGCGLDQAISRRARSWRWPTPRSPRSSRC